MSTRTKRKKHASRAAYVQANLQRTKERRKNSIHMGNAADRWKRLLESSRIVSHEKLADLLMDR